MRPQRMLAVMLVLGVTAATLATGVGSAGAAPVVTVTPNSALVDGQKVTVSGTGFTSGVQVAVIECLVGATSQNDCDTSTLVFANADNTGHVTTPYTVYRRLFPASNSSGLDCAPARCRITLANIVTQTEAASTTVTFDATVPLPPALQISAAIDPTASFDKAGNVTITGTVTCNLPALVSLEVLVTERAGRLLLHADGSTVGFCSGTTHFWVKAAALDGVFRGGSATVSLSYDSFSSRRDVFGTVGATVRLHG